MHQDDLDAEVSRLRRLGRDDEHIEVKASATSLSKDIWDSISAFANFGGGVVILGLDEGAAFAPAKGFALQRVLDQFVDGMGDANPGGRRLTNAPRYHIGQLYVDAQAVLVIDIAENPPSDKPCFVTAKGLVGGSFKRVGDKDLRMSATEVFELQHLTRDHEADRSTVVEARPEDLDPDRVGALLESRRGSKALSGTADHAARLHRLNVTDGEGKVRLAGLLTLGQYPQQFFPRLIVDVTVHPTLEKAAPSGQLRFLDRTTCEGPLAEVVEDAVAAVAKNLRTYSVVEGAGRIDRLEVPREVVREAIANAVLHREYHHLFLGQPVSVDVYPDRVVVTSPGGLWGGKTLENLDDGLSKCRNQTLLQILQHIPLASHAGSVVEGQGSGVRFMINEMRAHALERPIFRATPDFVTVELRRHGAEVPAYRRWLTDVAPEGLSHRQDVALLTAQREGHVSVPQLQAALQADSDVIRETLRHLVAQGLLLRGPEDYVLAEISGNRRAPQGAELAVLNVMSISEPLDVHVIAATAGETVGAVRPLLRRLIAEGRVTATAPATSRHRRYLRTP